MAINVPDAETYITSNCMDNEDFLDATAAKKQLMLTVAKRELSAAYPKYTIPDNSVYEFAAVLGVVFNDTNKMAQQGVTSLSLSGVASFNFKEGNVRPPGADLVRFMPQTCVRIIGEANGVSLSGRRSGRSVL